MTFDDLLSPEDLEPRAVEIAETHRESAATPIAELMPLARHAAQLEALLRATDQRARFDPLTGLLRRDPVFSELDRALLVGSRTQSTVGVVMIDLDHFKQVNDTHGHAAGDRVLRAVGQVIRENIREADFAGRYGGEELMVVTTGSDRPEVLAEKLRGVIELLDFGPGLTVTASFGVSTWGGGVFEPDFSVSRAELMEAADVALYRAKENGRNRVEVAV